MKSKLFALSSALLLSSLSAAGCTATPESYYKASTRVGCRALKKCEESLWNEAGYDNVGDCVDETFKVADEDDFADACPDYDKKEARKCLSSARKYKRSCDEDDIDNDACAKVCGTPSLPGTQELTPEERGRAAAEARFASGEITEQELEEELTDIEIAAQLEDEEDEALLQAEIDAVFDAED